MILMSPLNFKILYFEATGKALLTFVFTRVSVDWKIAALNNFTGFPGKSGKESLLSTVFGSATLLESTLPGVFSWEYWNFFKTANDVCMKSTHEKRMKSYEKRMKRMKKLLL